MPADRSPACSCASPVLRDSTAQGCQGVTWAARRLLQLLIGTQHLARAALRGCRDVCCSGASLDAGFSQRGWRICASVPTAPRAVASVCGRRRAVSWSTMAAGIRASLVPAQACHENLAHSAAGLPHTYVQPITRSRAHRAASTQPSAVGQQCTQSLCTAQTALSSSSARRDGSLSSHGLPEPAQRRTPTRISRSDSASLSWSSIHSLETVPTQCYVTVFEWPFCPSLSLPHSVVLLV